MSERKLPITNHITAEVKRYASRWIREKVPACYTFHGLSHTLGVVKAAAKIADKCHLLQSEKEDLLIAAWFHDTGYDQGAQNHEQRSAAYATQFLKSRNYSLERISQVQNMISATRFINTPNTKLEEVIRDADMAHLGNVHYWENCNHLRKELELVQKIVMNEEEWIAFELDFMHKHEYHTKEARQLYKGQKQLYIEELLSQQRKVKIQ